MIYIRRYSASLYITHTYTLMHTQTYMLVHMHTQHTHMYAIHAHTCIRTCMYVCRHVCTYPCTISQCIYFSTHTHTYANMHMNAAHIIFGDLTRIILTIYYARIILRKIGCEKNCKPFIDAVV